MRYLSRSLVTIAALLITISAVPGWGGEPPVQPGQVLRPTGFGVTPPLSEIEVPKPAEGVEFYEIPNRPVTELPTLPGASAPDQVMGEGFITPDAGVLAPAPMIGFDGNNSDDNQAVIGFRLAPPDTQGAVGLNYYVQWVNLTWSIYDKGTGAEVIGPLPGNSLWQSLPPGSACRDTNNGDPITLFDHAAQRWFMSQFALPGPNYTCLAVSQTSDPTGAWYVWEYNYGSLMNDYPKFGVWPDGYYMTVNEFSGALSATTVFDRTAMLAGNPSPAAQYFSIESVQPSFPQPTNLDGGPPPPVGSPNYNIAFYDDAWGNPADILQICELAIDWSTPANSTFACPAGPGDPGYIDLTAAGLSFDSNLCGYSRNCIPQPGTQTVDALSDRLMFPANYRNLMSAKGYEVMTITHSVDASGADHAGIRWYELRNTGTGWFIHDGGTFAPDADHRWMGSSAVDQEGNIGLIYSISSSSTNPSVGYTARLATDPAGSMQTEQVLVAGGGSQSSVNRWGDYAAMHVDPGGCTFWGTAEYVNTGGSWIWDTYIGAFSMPGCTPSGFGTVDGTVTNSSSGFPIPGALVAVGAYSTFSHADGTYGVNVPADTYDVTATAFGFASQTVNGVVVDDAVTVTQDFALDPLETAFLDGFVTDDGHGWPLYARVDILFGGLNVATTFTSPFDGHYAIELPHSSAYDLAVTAVFPGYGAGSRSIVLDSGGQTESFILTATAPACTAPGYTAGTPCVTIAGAMVEGFVTDANTGDALNGGTVANDMGGSTTTMSTPDDPAIGDGFYFLFTEPAPGASPEANTITASASGYANGVASLDFVQEMVNQLDFALNAGWLEFVPDHLESRLNAGLTENQPVSILNHGGAAASLTLLAFERAGWVPSLPMDEIGAPTAPPEHLNDPTAEASTMPEREPAAPLAAGDVIQSWGSGLGSAWGLAFNQHTSMPWVGEGWGNDTIYEYTAAGAQTGTSYVAPWNPAYGPADYTFDFLTGMIWVMDVGGDECLHELDPASGYTGDTLCWGSPISERGVAYDPLGDTFFVGGWNTAAITRIDRDGTVLQVANVGLAIAGLAYNPVTEHLFVMVNGAPNLVYVLDVPDNYNQIGSFGIAGVADYSGAGLDIACDGHLWVVNQTNEMVLEVDSGETGACLSASLPWLVLTPDTGVVPASGGGPGELPINAEFIADGVDHFGLVQGNILVIHDTPYDVNGVPVCFTRAFADVAPTFWADDYIHSLAGARITTGCGGADFCSTDEMPRHVMARWLVKVLHGPDFAVPPCMAIFDDVVCDTTPNADHIEQLYADGITTGCRTDPLEYCPFDTVNRAQMATFITRLAYGPDFVPPPATGTVYPDVAAGFWAAPYIEWLTSEGVVSGFPDGLYKPLLATTRAQMAKMVVLSAGLPMCESGP